MIVGADDIADTLRLLIPGFVALKLFYQFGLRTKRADWEWALWSVLVSVPLAALSGAVVEWIGSWSVAINGHTVTFAQTRTQLEASYATCSVTAVSSGTTTPNLPKAFADCADQALRSHNPGAQLLVALLLALLTGAVGALLWKAAVRRWPNLALEGALMAWDAVLSTPHYVKIKVGDVVYSGWQEQVASPIETDTLDIYVRDPVVVNSDGTTSSIPYVEGILVTRDDLDWVQVIAAP